MTQPHDKALMEKIVESFYGRNVLALRYAPDRGARERVVEPYAITETPDGVMMRAYQLEPAPAWRFFDLRLIESVRETGTVFTPRRPIVIRLGKEWKHVGPVASEDREEAEYRKRLLGVLADMQVTPDEAHELAEMRTRLGLTDEETRGVHYGVFADCLSTVVGGGLVTGEELAMLRDLNRCLKACGAGMLD